MTTDHGTKVRTLEGSPYRSLEEFLQKHGPRPQVFSVYAAQENTIVGRAGTRLSFPAHALRHPNGQAVEGEIELHLTEVFGPAAMMLSNRSSTSEDRLLESSGQIQIYAYQNGSPLVLEEALQVELPVPEDLRNPLGMRLFEARHATVQAFPERKRFDWRLTETPMVHIRKLNGRKYYVFQIHRFNSYECAGWLPVRRKTRVMVSVRPIIGTDKMDGELAFLSFPGLNTVVRMYRGGSAFTAFNIPAGLTAEVLILGIRGGQLYLGRNRFNQAKDKVANVYLRPCAEVDILEVLQTIGTAADTKTS